MSIEVAAGRIRLDGDCGIEDSELLVQALLDNPDCPVDIRNCGRVHMAMAQVLFAARRPIEGSAKDDFVAQWLVPQWRGVASEA